MLDIVIIIRRGGGTMRFAVPGINTYFVAIEDLHTLKNVQARQVLIPDDLTDHDRDFAYDQAEAVMAHLPEDQRMTYFYKGGDNNERYEKV